MANATVIIPFSGSTQGKGIKIAATATLGTTIHTGQTSATLVDRVYMWAYNDHTADVQINIEFGGVTVPDNVVRQTIPFKAGLVPIMIGNPILGSGVAALSITGFSTTTPNVIVVYGYILRITP